MNKLIFEYVMHQINIFDFTFISALIIILLLLLLLLQ